MTHNYNIKCYSAITRQKYYITFIPIGLNFEICITVRLGYTFLSSVIFHDDTPRC
jgi:hypothetical protein